MTIADLFPDQDYHFYMRFERAAIGDFIGKIQHGGIPLGHSDGGRVPAVQVPRQTRRPALLARVPAATTAAAP